MLLLVAALVLAFITAAPFHVAAAELTTVRVGHNGFSSELPLYVARDAVAWIPARSKGHGAGGEWRRGDSRLRIAKLPTSDLYLPLSAVS